MRFTYGAILGLVCCGSPLGCGEGETTISVSVRYWTDYLDPETFALTIRQAGRAPVQDDQFSPAKLLEGDSTDGRRGYDVLCEESGRLKDEEGSGATYGNYCRFFKRYPVPGWGAGEVRVKFAADTLAGETFEPPRDTKGTLLDATEIRFELTPHEVNVVYFELEDSTLTGDPASLDDAGVAPQIDGGVYSDAGEGASPGRGVDAGVGSAPQDVDAATPMGATRAETGTKQAGGVRDSGAYPSGRLDSGRPSASDAGTAPTGAESISPLPAPGDVAP